jgi:hypothetical protein
LHVNEGGIQAQNNQVSLSVISTVFQGGGAASEISGDEETNLVGNDGTQSHTWDTFSSLLNLTFFVITFVTYLILLIGFIP